MANIPDGQYNRRPWDYTGPFASKEEQLATQALSVASIPGDMLSEVVRPPLPQIKLFPPRYGYRTRQLGINDILNVDELYQSPPTRVGGILPGAVGTERNAQGTGSW
jgi:hypothetical protein